eukprot:m.214680 g.214680  ORF g.214680 m.214680 type:complete len:153 (+) comp39818_c0_seq1:1621-2079(+)
MGADGVTTHASGRSSSVWQGRLAPLRPAVSPDGGHSDSYCSLCGECLLLPPGSRIAGIAKGGGKSATSFKGSGAKLCRLFNFARDRCWFGESCKFAHEGAMCGRNHRAVDCWAKASGAGRTGMAEKQAVPPPVVVVQVGLQTALTHFVECLD